MNFRGASSIGVTLTTMNPVYTPKEISRQLKMSSASWAVVNSDLVPIINAAIQILESEGVIKRGAWRDRIIVTGGNYLFTISLKLISKDRWVFTISRKIKIFCKIQNKIGDKNKILYFLMFNEKFVTKCLNFLKISLNNIKRFYLNIIKIYKL